MEYAISHLAYTQFDGKPRDLEKSIYEYLRTRMDRRCEHPFHRTYTIEDIPNECEKLE